MGRANKSAVNSKGQLRNLILCAILCALVVAMTFVPYTGYITVTVIEITTLHIVVILGAVLLGWKYGLIIGTVWGVTCLIRAYMMPVFLPFGFGNPLVSVLPRMLVGFVAGIAFAGLKKTRLSTTVSLIIATVLGSLTNTVLVLTAMSIFVRSSAVDALYTIFNTLISLNGGLELGLAIIIVPSVFFALQPRVPVLGIDLGASATKIALMRGKRCLQTHILGKDETLEQALDNFSLAGVRRIAITGVGASYIQGNIRGVETVRVDEFGAISRGAALLAKRHSLLVASVGTGTSFVRVTPFGSSHVGGTGLGGGTLQGLSLKLVDTTDMAQLTALAKQGSKENVDLILSDVCQGTISNLTPTTTVSNMAKVDAGPKDLALGLMNLVFEGIGVMAALACKVHLTRTVVLVGTSVDNDIARDILQGVAKLHKIRFVVPQNAPFATAIGAARTIR